MDQLEGLGDELHLADTAFAQLDVFRHPLAPDLLLDQLLHGAQRLDGGKVQVAPIDERPQHAEQLLACLLVAADHPRLDHRVALPVAPLVLVVLLQRGEAVDQRSAGAVGTQAHVDAEDEAVDGDRIQRLDQLLPQAGEELLVVQRTLRPLGLAALRVTEDQVDVRRQVEFHRAQLAHAEDHHPLRFAGAPADRRAELLALAPMEPLASQVDAGVGQGRQVATGFRQRGAAGQVAPDDAQLLACAETSQAPTEFVLVGAILQPRLQLTAQFAGRLGVLQLAAFGQFQQHRRVAHCLLGDEIAGRGDPSEILQALLGPGLQAGQGGGIEGGDSGAEGSPGAFGGGQQGGRQIRQRRQAHGLSCLGFRPKTTGSTHNVEKALHRAL
ncbi:hypothetical protein PAERUG_P45_London_17_VIM_2_12_12_01725 [Pseudomonas aeruginosa]|nr:hypothetical protein PAERUG_P15_London_17_VIM_2_02_10_01733 [Pseudomonas aeruginosa]CRQ79834.1 hypothetical protein PAERUG_P45_London_17_VIM_2_12_12_01725 [Pseudomonas aeruginosa]CRR26669.1 hypothetical protein PAERUG_E15_London_28_01_14_08526 [Pseudomonas aeruginosa]CRX27283.1 hypothetical protein PAERUG_P54_1_London_24_VIM_2_04_13_04584 [Pseudomonas aeruginosa]